MSITSSPTPPPGLTARLGAFIADTPSRQASTRLQTMVRNGFVDTVATMIAGRAAPVVLIARRWASLRQNTRNAQAHALLGWAPMSARDSALVNGVAAHALDYDDVGLQGHPSAVLVSALLAEGERLGASGNALLNAYVTGHEVWAELISRDQDLHHLKGWHPTGIFGTLGAAAAVAALRGLDAQRAAHALGLAASMAAGLTANFGSMAKPFHAGQAAAHGIDAVDLAEAGMTAAPDVLEHPTGFLTAVSAGGQVNREPPPADFGAPARLESLGLTVKKYPMCFATHRVIDAALDLVTAHDISPTQLVAAEATVGSAQASMLRNARPRNGLEAKFSLQFAVAAPLVARACGLGQLEDTFVQRPEVQAIFEKLSIRTVNTSHPTEPTLAASDRLVLQLSDGRRLDSGEVFVARGEASAPLSEQDLAAKFHDCARGVESRARAALLDSLLNLPEAPSVAQIVQAGRACKL
ncbi:MmgE/PrpD family protein [Ottowia thiooxydans]|uniref:Aconitate decarboxylase n=1 Tax=Ottowia thiooxydans TaxID=219182 RepID=A0ABV2Q807_9BURK